MKLIVSLAFGIGATGFSMCHAQSPADPRPNILFVVADDLGFTDVGAFGGEIPTPNLDSLAFQGVRLTNLHAAPACQPSRVMMMSSSGVSAALEVSPPQPNGERDNLLSKNWAILPELMQDAGYRTYMTGKWDLGLREGYTPASRGFDRSFVQLGASASHFPEVLWGEESLYELDGVRVPYEDLPADFYSTNYYTDRMIDFIESDDSGAPWFAYVPYTTPHWPLQVPEDSLDDYAGHYDAGYDALREKRVARATALGIIPDGARLDDFQSLVPRWSELTAEQQRKYARTQEIYAAMVENLDVNVGRLIAYLKESGQIDNTVILFTSDHGASNGEHGHMELRPGQGGAQMPEFIDNGFENWGRPNSFVDHGYGFGEAASAPFRALKATLNEGGLRGAAFVYYPQTIQSGKIDHSLMSFMDILPTFLDIADTQHPGAGPYDGRTINDIKGKSVWPYLTGERDEAHLPTDTMGWAYRDGGALIRGDFKIINTDQGGRKVSSWQLYDLSSDPGERHDLAQERPELMAELVAEWEAEWR